MEDNSEKTWCIKVNNVSVKWCSNLLNNTLENLSIELEKGKLYAAIGTIGAGKSSFLSMILGEIKFVKGNINLIGNISYAAQDAWVFGASIQQNILFGQEFNKERYVSVIDACAIAKDLEEFSDADNTLIDEKGSSLSGGQKVRINLARAIYKEADIYLLDDPLSAVDVNVGKYLFEKCILQYLKDKTRILVTHQLQNIKNVDGIMLFDQGKMQYYKDYRKLLEAHPEYNNLIVRDNDESSNKDNCVENINVRKQCTSIENKFQLFGCKERVTEDNKKSKKFNDTLEETSKDVVKGSVFLYYFQLDSSLCTTFIMVILFILTQILVILNDFYVPFIVTAEKNKNDFNKQSNASNSFTSEKDVIPKESFYSTETYIYFYTAIVLSIFLIGLLRSYVFFNACLRNNKCLHNLTLAAILRARLHFFNTNSSGRILNRFSKDMATVDEHLPRTLLDTAQVLLTIFGAFIVTCIINPIFLIYGLVISCVTYWIKKIYLKTSKNLKRLEGMTRSPIFTHLNVTLNGISTIRAFKSQTNLNEEFDKFQDNHTSSWYLCTACGFAYSFALDLCTLSFIICITLNFLIFKDQFNSGEVGLAITQILWVTTMVQWGMRQIAEVNNQMLSVERILEYKQIPPEDNVYNQIKSFKKTKNENEQNLLPTIIQRLEHWPSEGTITFRDIFMAYEKEKKPVLKNLNFQINAMEKIGIVGRTGAGKSSLIYAIFRLAYLNGIIEIDKIDTATISLDELRSRISIIPQDPVLFSGTLRCNLDPFNEFSDKDLWGALEEVELKDSIVGYKNGLNYRVLNKGMNFSVGQRQLICLARAILRNNCILIVDEATANVDPQTDYFIQQTIRRKFASCTILTIAHRLNIIIDSDKIMFMDNGYLVEFDHPYKLLQKKESHFNILAKKTGDVMYKQLFKLAQQCYNKKCNNCI